MDKFTDNMANQVISKLENLIIESFDSAKINDIIKK